MTTPLKQWALCAGKQELKWHWQCAKEDTQLFCHVNISKNVWDLWSAQQTNIWDFIQYVCALFLSNLTTEHKERSMASLKLPLLQPEAPLTKEKQTSTNRPDELGLTTTN